MSLFLARLINPHYCTHRHKNKILLFNFKFKEFQFFLKKTRRGIGISSNSYSGGIMSVLRNEVRISVCQMTSGTDKKGNLSVISGLCEKASSQGSKIVFLPECADYVAENKIQTAELSESLEGTFIKSVKEIAKTYKIWISIGGFHERRSSLRPDGYNWTSNTHVLLDDNGEISRSYRKIHLFNVSGEVVGTNRGLNESESIYPGDEIVEPVSTPFGLNVGLGICYDLRFPEFSRILRNNGANFLTFPSAFTVPTGMAHWEPLLRARAIENQCFVVAAAQFGQHNSNRTSYGHAMVVDPWGKVLKEAADHESIFHVDIDLQALQNVRSRMPVHSHMRLDVYQKSSGGSFAKNTSSMPKRFNIPTNEGIFQFSIHKVPKSMSFLESTHSVAIVNKKCVLPGHVLVITKRVALRLTDLHAEETADLFELVKIVQKLMEKVHKTNSSTITVQDGECAGQTVQHVHVHLIPRKAMDFEQNDTIYEKLANHDKGEVKWRTEAEMKDEAAMLRGCLIKYFYDELLQPTNTT